MKIKLEDEVKVGGFKATLKFPAGSIFFAIQEGSIFVKYLTLFGQDDLDEMIKVCIKAKEKLATLKEQYNTAMKAVR